ncbi:GTPase-activating protein IML1 [Sporobolomyces salmoneus]|uniref:GTPase-activating protein IML1 n=1 Tax=Sporobolomyces salmoneus TaxID=183962 RepID=UPI00317717F3
MAQVYELHIDTSATSDIQISSACFPPNSSPGDLIAVRPHLEPGSKGKGKDSPLLYKIEHTTEEPVEGKVGSSSGVQRRRTAAAVTVSPTLAAAFGWVQNRIRVELSLIASPPPPSLCASHVELYFNNLYLSRPDSFILSLSLIGKVIHSNQRIFLPGSGARLRVGDMWSSTSSQTAHRRRRGSTIVETAQSTSHNLDSAYVTDSTKLIFRSESSRSYIFIEVSQEMWQFEEDGGMLVEKCEMFLEEVFAHFSGKMSKDSEDKRSKGIPTSHVVSIILYGRVIYDNKEDAEEERAPLSQASDGTLYRDFFKVILDVTPSPSASIIQTVASELRRWQELVLLRTREDGTEKLSGRLACAHESPVLEATNLALNSFEEHWIDRDLHRTGLEVIVLTAGSSFYQVDKQLLRLTTERMLYHGIGLDLISLSKMPLHSVPLFQFSSPDPAAVTTVQGEVWDASSGAGGTSVTGMNAEGGGQQRHEGIAVTPHKFDTLFPNQPVPSSLRSGKSPAATLSSPSSRHPPLRHRRSISSIRDMDRALPSSPLREVHQPASSVQAQSHQRRGFPSTPQSILNKTTDSIHTSSGVGTIARDITSVPDDQRDPLYYDPLPTPATQSQQSHSRAPSSSTVPFPASATTRRSSTSLLPGSPLPPLASSSPAPPLAYDPPSLPPPLPTSLYYSEPLFVFPHFFGTQPDKPHRVDRFMPRARCYELFSQGLGGKMPLALPLLKHDPAFAGIRTIGIRIGQDGSGGGIGKKGYLDEMEDKLRRREMFDAAALGVQHLDPVAMAMNEEGSENANGGGGIVIGRKGNWGTRREVGSRQSVEESYSGVSEEISTGPESYGGEGSESTSISEGDSQGSLSERSDKEKQRDGSRRGSRSLVRKESESEGDESGFGIGMPSVMVATVQSDARHSRQRRAGSMSTTASSTQQAEGEADRGRQFSRKGGPSSHVVPLPSNDSGGRSKTPVPKHRRKERDSSVAASIRTNHSIKHGSLHSNATNRKASTPALIARLTGGPAPSRSDPPDLPPTSSSSSSTLTANLPSPTKSTVHLPRPSWLSLFSRTNSSASAATITPSSSSAIPAPPPSAPQVAVARVDVQANLKSEVASSSTAGSVTGSPVLSATSISERPPSIIQDQAEAELAVAASSDMSRDQRSQPITIGSKAGSTNGKVEDGRDQKANGAIQETNSKKQNGRAPGQISGSLKAYEPGEAMRKGLGKGKGRISVAARFNPSKPGKRSVGLADQARRWAGILVVERKNMRLGVKWRSITRGACLPITTDYIPSSDVLSSQYSEYRYSVPTNSVTSSFLLRPDHPKRSHILTLVTELICQRLSHGFQIYTPAPSREDPDSSKTLPDVLHEIQNGETTAVYLSLSNQVHRIWYDRRSQSVFVKILRRRRTWAKPEYEYRPLIWTQSADRADVTSVSCPYPSMVDPVEWQHCDRLVAGAESFETNETVRYRSTRLVLLPALKIPDRDYIVGRTKALQVEEGEEVTDEMIQEQGFYTLLDLIENARWTPSGIEKVPVSIHQTTLDAPSWASSIAKQAVDGTNQPQSSSTNASPALAPTQPAAIARTGWLSRMQSKAGAEESQPSTPMLGERDFDLLPTPSSSHALSLPDPKTSSLGKSSEDSSKRPIVKMTHAVILDLDPTRRSERAERVICHLDRSHNVQAAYHIELAWLTASGKTVDNAIQAWSRQMARYGVTLVEVSTRPVLARHNPFQKPSIIRPVLAPPVSSDPNAPSQEQYLSHLLRSLDFFLDLGSDSTFPSHLHAQYSYRRAPVLHSQYIHRSGSAIVSILAAREQEDGDGDGIIGFAYVPNRIFTSHHPAIDEDEPKRMLESLCRDEERLKEIWEEFERKNKE